MSQDIGILLLGLILGILLTLLGQLTSAILGVGAKTHEDIITKRTVAFKNMVALIRLLEDIGRNSNPRVDKDIEEKLLLLFICWKTWTKMLIQELTPKINDRIDLSDRRLESLLSYQTVKGG